MHELGLIITLSTSLAAALLFGFITHRLGLSPILGYLVAGVAIGPYTPGFVADTNAANQLAEIGVVLLMFGVGLHFHLSDLLAVRFIAVPGAVGQTLIATALGALLGVTIGWSFGAGLVLGLCISVASTVVLIRVLTDAKRLDSIHGRVAVGWLVVEDILTVLILVLLPALTGATDSAGGRVMSIAGALGWALIKVGFLVVAVLFGGKRAIPWLLTRAARTGSRELFTLTILVVALGIATASVVFFGVSMALGAFLAGMVVGQSNVSHQAAADALPLRDAFAVLFFVSVGMLFSPSLLMHQPWLVAGTLAIILVAKPLIAIALILALRYSVRTALVVSLGLAQIGEFSFILAKLGRSLNVLPADGESAVIAGAIFSIALSPMLVRAVDPLEGWLKNRPPIWAFLNGRSRAYMEAENRTTAAEIAREETANHAIVVGFGPVGQTLHRLLREFELKPVVIDLNVETVERLKADGLHAIYGDAARSELLKAAGIEKAAYLLVTVPDFASRFSIIIAARGLNPNLKIFVRAHYVGERAMLEEVGATDACYEEAEAATALAKLLLSDVGVSRDRVEVEIQRLRVELALHRGEPLALGA